MITPMKSSMSFPSGLSARFRDGGAPARRVKRECLAQAGFEQPGRQQPTQPGQKNCLADRPPHAVVPLDRSQHFLGDEPRLRRRVGVVSDQCRRPLALRTTQTEIIKVAVDPD
jgi:hypothetical protein